MVAKAADQLKGYQLAPVTDPKNDAKSAHRVHGVKPQAIERQAAAKSTPGSPGTGQAKEKPARLPLKRTREVYEGECSGYK